MGGRRQERPWPEAPTPAMVTRAVREAFEGPAWHGPTVRSALRGVTWEKASWRPAPGRNTIWALVLHLAYVRHRVMVRLGRLTGRTVPRFPRVVAGSWFPRVSDPCDSEGWQDDLSLLESYHQRLLSTLAEVEPGVLGRSRKGADRSLGAELMGVAFHDAYHAGQIKLLAKLAPEARQSARPS